MSSRELVPITPPWPPPGSTIPARRHYAADMFAELWMRAVVFAVLTFAVALVVAGMFKVVFFL